MLKNNRFIKIYLVFILIFFSGVYTKAYANYTLNVDPFGYFNVYSLGDIGQENDLYNSDIEGTIGAAGNAYFGGFGAPNLASNEYVLHTGGDFSIKSGGFAGKIDVGGNVSIANYRVTHDINAGGNVIILRSTSGAATATVRAAGIIDQYRWNNINAIGEVPYDPIFDFDILNQYFLDTSSAISAMSEIYETKTYSQPYSNAYFNVESGVNVFEINATDFYETARYAAIVGPADAIVYINATDTDAHLGWSMNWDFIGGVTQSNVILNFADATSLRVSGGEINVLAPLADTTFTAGAIKGNLITGNLYGGAQVNQGYFEHPPAIVPEPSSVILFSCGMAILFCFNKRARKPSNTSPHIYGNIATFTQFRNTLKTMGYKYIC